MKTPINKVSKKYRKILFKSPKDEYFYFPVGVEDKYSYLERGDFEKKLLNNIKVCKKGDGKIVLIKSEKGNGNTSLLNYLTSQIYNFDPPYSHHIISIRGIPNERLTILKRIYPDVYGGSFSSLKKFYIALCYKLKFWQAFLLVLSIISIYLFVAYLLSIATHIFPSLLLNLISLIGIQGFVSILFGYLWKLNSANLEKDEDLEEKLKENLSKKLKSDIHSYFMLVDNPYGFYLFIDHIENLDNDSCVILSQILQDRKNLGMICCVIPYTEESSVIKDIKENYGREIIEENLRPFDAGEIKLLAERYKRNVDEQAVESIRVAELVRGITPEEEKALRELCKFREDSTKAFDDLAVMYYMFFVPFEQRKIPIVHVIKGFFKKYLSRYFASLIRNSYQGKALKIPSSEPHWEDYQIEIQEKNQKVPLLDKIDKSVYTPNLRFSELLKEINRDFFDETSLGSLKHIYLFWGLFYYHNKDWGLGIVNRFVECFKNCDVNLSIPKEMTDKIDISIFDGLLRGSIYLLDNGIDFSGSFSALTRLWEKMESKSIDDNMRVKVIDNMLRIYFLTYDCHIRQSVENLFLSTKFDVSKLPSDILARFLFCKIIGSAPLNEIEPLLEKLDEDPISNFVKLLSLIKERSLWFSNGGEMKVDIPKISTDNAAFEEFILSFLRADILRNNNNYKTYWEEVEDMLTRLSLFYDIKQKTRLQKGLIKPYLEAKILHYAYDLLLLSRMEKTEHNNIASLQEDLNYLFKIKNITPGELFLEATERYEKIMRIAYYAEANSLLVDTYFSYAKLLYSQYIMNPKEREQDRERIEMLIKKGITIEEANDISILSPSLYCLWRKCLAYEARSIHIYTKFFETLKRFNYPAEVKMGILKELLKSLNRHGETATQYQQLLQRCDEYLELLEKSGAEDLQKKLEEIEVKLLSRVQPLRMLGLIDRAKKELDEIEIILKNLPEIEELIPLRITYNIIRFDLFTSMDPDGNLESRREIIMNLYWELMKYIEKFTTPENEDKKRILYFLNKLDEIIARVTEFIKSKEELENIAKRFYIYNQKELNTLSKWRDPLGYLKAGYRLIQYLMYYNENLTITLLKNLQYLAELERQIDYELIILDLLIKILHSLNEWDWKYQSRYQQIVKMRVKNIMSIDDEEQQFVEIERSSMSYFLENTPDEIRERLKESMALFYKRDIKECLKLLKGWYENWQLRQDIFYDEIQMMDLLLKCYENIEPKSSQEIINKLKTDIFRAKRYKMISEIERLTNKIKDPETLEVLKVLRDKLSKEIPK